MLATNFPQVTDCDLTALSPSLTHAWIPAESSVELWSAEKGFLSQCGLRRGVVFFFFIAGPSVQYQIHQKSFLSLGRFRQLRHPGVLSAAEVSWKGKLP